MLQYKNACYSWTELNNNNNKIDPRGMCCVVGDNFWTWVSFSTFGPLFPYVVFFSYIRVFFREWESDCTHIGQLKRSVFVCGCLVLHVSRFTHMWVSCPICGCLSHTLVMRSVFDPHKNWWRILFINNDLFSPVRVSFHNYRSCGSLSLHVSRLTHMRVSCPIRGCLFPYVGLLPQWTNLLCGHLTLPKRCQTL